jgi:hypothetical protein
MKQLIEWFETGSTLFVVMMAIFTIVVILDHAGLF